MKQNNRKMSKVCSKGLSIWRLVAINAVAAGLEIAACVAFTYIPPLLLKSGFSETQMSIILGIAPFLALFVVPIMGRWSDSCTSRFGRRRPFILALSVVLVFSLILLYIGQSLGTDNSSRAVRMFLLSVGVVLLDFASQTAINPCEALVSDVMVGQTGDETGFTVYSGMLSVGACVGYLVTALDWTTLGITSGTREQTAFMLVLFTYLVCLMITLTCAREQRYIRPADRLLPINKSSLIETTSDPGYGSGEEIEMGRSPTPWSRPISSRSFILSTFKRCNLTKVLTAPGRLIVKAICIPLTFYRTISSAPQVLKDLFYADFASWVAIMAHGMFYTDFVATAVYGGQPDAPTGSVYDLLFDEGVRMGSWGLLLHSITACIYAVFIQEHVTRALGLRRSYQLGLIMFSVSMAATVLNTSSLTNLNLAAAASGVGYAVVTTVPNTLVTMYHENPYLYYGSDAGKAGLGADIAILDSGYYLSQIWLSLIMGQLVEITGLPHYYIIVACIAGLVAAVAANRVVFTASDLNTQKSSSQPLI